MLMKAIPGGKIPVRGKPGQHITDDKAVNVPNNSYYRRLVAEGSLIEVPLETTNQKPSAKPRKEGGK